MTQAETKQTITVHLEPEMKTILIKRPKTVMQLLQVLNLSLESALVARNGKLLTYDRRIWPGDELLVRVVMSSG